MKDIDRLTEKIKAQEKNIRRLIKIGYSLSYEKDLKNILEVIVEEAMFFTNCEGGTLYFKTKDEKHLEFVIAQNSALGIKMGGSGEKISWPLLNLYNEDDSENLEMVAVVSALQNRIINIEDVYDAEDFNFEGTRRFDKDTGYRSKSMLVVPMQDYDGNVIGVLQLINKKEKEKVVSFKPSDEEFVLSLSSQAAVAIGKNLLIEGLENLLQAFLKSIAVAIDKKSPYTGGHIRRVAELTQMLVEKINRDDYYFPDTNYTQNEIKQVSLAAWMHDIGKIVTPEYVVDKATKLETIHDRIETVQNRFEVLKRDMHIKELEKEIELLKSGQEDKIDERKSDISASIKKIDEDFDVVKRANSGMEFVGDEMIEQIEKISKRSVEIGGKKTNLLDKDEVSNLSIRKGTLTEPERQRINDHAKVSLDMLSELPFPKKYSAIPKIAAGHHEKINGKGYPLGLKGDELSFETRILAVADIFEALTASDRPYKKAMNLSHAMKILFFMVKDGELDEDIVKFFYESGLYKEYAEKELKKENIDEVDLQF